MVGLKNVDRALAGLERRLGQHNARVQRMFTGRSSSGVGNSVAARRSGSPRDRMGQGFAEMAKAASLQQRADARAIKSRERLEETAARRRAATEQRTADQAFRRKTALQNRHFAAEQRATERIESIKLREGRLQAAGRSRFVQSTIGNTASRVGGATRAVGATGAAVVGLGGAALAASAISQASRLDDMSRRFSIAGRGKGETGLDPEAVRSQVTRIGIANGVDPEAVMAGAAKFQAATGDAKAALGMSGMFATVAQASGGNPEEVADAAAALFQNFNVKDIDAMGEALSRLNFQGKKGSFEFRDMASQLGRVTASFGARGVGSESLPEIGAILQVVQRGTKDEAKTTTGVGAMFRQLITKSGDLQSGAAFGGRKVQVFKDGDAKKGMRGDIGNLIADVITASRGDLTKLTEVFQDEGMLGANMFAAEFQRASSEAGGGSKGAEAGRGAILKMIAEFSSVSGDYTELQRDAADAMKSFSSQMAVFNAKLKEAVSSQLFPELVKLAPEMVKLVPLVADLTRRIISFVKFLSENPFTGIGAVIGASIALDIGKAQVGSMVAAAIARIFSGAPVVTPGGITGMPIPGVPGAPGAPGALKGRVAAIGGKVAGGAMGGALGFATGSAVGQILGGDNGQETGSRVGAAAGIGAGVAGPVGALVGTSIGMLGDSIDGFLTQLKTGFAPDENTMKHLKQQNSGFEEQIKAAREAAEIMKAGAKATAEELKKGATGINRGNSPTPPKITPG